MTNNLYLSSCVLALALLSLAGMTSAAPANLSIEKTVSLPEPFETGGNVTWVVTLYNSGPLDATNITVTEDFRGLAGLDMVAASPSTGTFNLSARTWTVPLLENDTSTTLKVFTTFNTTGVKTNRFSITASDQADLNPADDAAERNVTVVKPVSAADKLPEAHLEIRPTTLNLKSGGVFSVFVTLDSGRKGGGRPRVDYANSSLSCSGASLVEASVSNRDGGTLVAKFYRADLRNVTGGDGVRITCNGTLSADGRTIEVNGGDTVRVIGEKRGMEGILLRILTFLGIGRDDVVVNETADGSLTLTIPLNGAMRDELESRPGGTAVPPANTTIMERGGTKKGEEVRAGKGNGHAPAVREDTDQSGRGKEKNGPSRQKQDERGSGRQDD